jgi:hypothetical protein
MPCPYDGKITNKGKDARLKAAATNSKPDSTANSKARATALGGFGEFHGYGIHAVAQAGGLGAVIEDVA